MHDHDDNQAPARGVAEGIDTSGASTFDLELTAPAQGGQMVARLAGQVTFVSGGIPGETVGAYVPTRRRGYLEGRATGVDRPSPDRVAPPCPYFGENGHRRGAIDGAGTPGPVCGGCQYQHIAYARQCVIKAEVLGDVLRRVGKIIEAPIVPMVPSPLPYHYRNKASWLVTAEGELAYREGGSHTPVVIDQCPQLSPQVEAILRAVQSQSAELGLAGLVTGIEARVLPGPDGSDRASLVLDLAPGTSPEESRALAEALVEICPSVIAVAGRRDHEGEPVALTGEARVEVAFLGQLLSVSPTAFFQVNLPVAEAIGRAVIEQCGTLAGRQLLDIYAGVGAFTLALAREADAVISIELDGEAVADARLSVERAGLENVTFLPGDAGESLRALMPGTIDCAVIDPPRSGCAPEVLRQLLRVKPTRLIYVSCDPATLARDLRGLLDSGYELERVQPFDLFPQTAHIEAICTLKLLKKFRVRRR